MPSARVWYRPTIERQDRLALVREALSRLRETPDSCGYGPALSCLSESASKGARRPVKMANPVRAQTSERRLSVLLIEDDLDDAELIRRALELGGFDVSLTVTDTEGGFIGGLANQPDVILSDYHLPAFSGARALRLAQQHAPQLPFIMISGSVGEETAVRLISQGANDCLHKSQLAQLPAAVESAIEQRRRRVATRSA